MQLCNCIIESPHTFTVKLATVGTAGRDAWFGIRWRRKTAKGQQSLESAATLTLGSMFLARFSTNLQRKIDLTNAFKSIFCDDSFQHCSKIVGFLGNTLGALGGRARTTKFGTCRVPYYEALVKASGKDLAQGQVALLDPT